MGRIAKRAVITSGLRGVIGCMLLALLAACSGVTHSVVGNEYRLTAKLGNDVVGGEARTSDERFALLARTIKSRRHKLGGKGVSWDELDFIPDAESTFTLPGGHQQILTIMYQSYKGARVIDGLQYGSFNAKDGTLQSVRAFLKDPATLPEPPKLDLRAWSEVHNVFREWLRIHKASKFNFVIEQPPVISARLHVAGYLARYAHRNADGTLSRFAAIIDPATDAVHVLYDVNTD